jgi:tetratricopeptide (TPR) repeat protein
LYVEVVAAYVRQPVQWIEIYKVEAGSLVVHVRIIHAHEEHCDGTMAALGDGHELAAKLAAGLGHDAPPIVHAPPAKRVLTKGQTTRAIKSAVDPSVDASVDAPVGVSGRPNDEPEQQSTTDGHNIRSTARGPKARSRASRPARPSRASSNGKAMDRQKLGKQQFNLALELEECGDLEGAATAYGMAVEWTPNYTDAWYNMAGVQQDLGRVEQAEEAYRQVVTLDPTYAEAFYNLGLVLDDQGELVKYNYSSVEDDYYALHPTSLHHHHRQVRLRSQLNAIRPPSGSSQAGLRPHSI